MIWKNSVVFTAALLLSVIITVIAIYSHKLPRYAVGECVKQKDSLNPTIYKVIEAEQTKYIVQATFMEIFVVNYEMKASDAKYFEKVECK